MRKGFSLVELLVVMAVLAILMTFLIPSMTSVLQGTNLTRGGQMLADQIGLARQYASTLSSTMEVRLVRLPDRSTDGYHAVQIWSTPPQGGAMTATSKLAKLPDGVAISTAAAISPYLALLTENGTMTAGGSSGAKYVAFRIRPGGTVSPQPSAKADLFLSVVPERLSGSSTVPKNFIAVQLNPDTASMSVFRP